MFLLNRRMPWLKPSAVIVMTFAVAAPALASPAQGSTSSDWYPSSTSSDWYPSTEELPTIAAAVEPKATGQPSPKAENQTPPPAPGQFKVDEEAAERALERTLIVQGALLLPFGVAEIQPSFSYSRSEVDDLNLFVQGGTPFLVERDIRRNALIADLFLRFGLPFESQLELGAPYRFTDSEEVAEISQIGRDTASSNSSGFGDFRIGLAKALLHEGVWWPNLIGRVTWDTDSGETDTRNPLGSGFNELTGSLTATKRQDPLVFLGSVSYTTSFEANRIGPGDELGFSVGALLAASPETSLRLLLNQTFVDKLKIDGRAIEGTDQVSASLSFGASSIIGHGKFLDFAAAAGLTDQASDYSVGVTLVVRFNVPSFSL